MLTGCAGTGDFELMRVRDLLDIPVAHRILARFPLGRSRQFHALRSERHLERRPVGAIAEAQDVPATKGKKV